MQNLRNIFIVSALLLCLFTNKIQAQVDTAIIRFGLIADTQYGDCEPGKTRFYREALAKLESSVNDINAQKVDFTINMGDFTDRNPNDLDTILKALSVLNKECYNIAGNHDFVGITDNEALYKKLGMPQEYYTFKKGNWKFIMLNTNELASYANIKGTWKEEEYNAMINKMKAEKRNNGASWNGGISSKQMEWLKNEVAESEKNGEFVIVFSHHQIYPKSGLAALNDLEILSEIGHSKAIKAMISGHNHTGAFAYYNHIPCITIEGMIETKETNAYAVLNIYKNEFTISGRGRAKSYKISVKE